MYKTLAAEMARRGITKKRLAQALGFSTQKLYLKLNGRSFLTLEDAIRIKAVIGVDMPLEELFEK